MKFKAKRKTLQASRHIMASRLKLKKGKKRTPPDPGRPDTLDYNEAAKNPAWHYVVLRMLVHTLVGRSQQFISEQ